MSEHNTLPWCALVFRTNEGGVTVKRHIRHMEAWTEEGLLYLQHNSDLPVNTSGLFLYVTQLNQTWFWPALIFLFFNKPVYSFTFNRQSSTDPLMQSSHPACTGSGSLAQGHSYCHSLKSGLKKHSQDRNQGCFNERSKIILGQVLCRRLHDKHAPQGKEGQGQECWSN